MTVAIYTHPACAGHDMGSGHPESPVRLAAVMQALDAPEFAGVPRREAPLVAHDRLALVHSRPYVDAMMRAFPDPETGPERVRLDADTALSPGSREAALRAAGAVVAAVDAVMASDDEAQEPVRRAFCCVRPPGHHAEPDRAMGFCLFNNIAIGAMHAHETYHGARVAVVDFDVHHGNGTEAMFAARPFLFYGSSHQWPLYPGTGRAEEHGTANNIVNVPLPPDSGSAAFRRAMTESILPAVRRFSPDLLMISAGFDAHVDDPLAQLALTDADFEWATGALVALAEECCGGRVVSVLEGGYDPDALGRAAAAHMRALLHHRQPAPQAVEG